MTAAVAPLPVTARPHRLAALARAELLQFRRNKTLLVMGTVFPLALPLMMFFAGRGDGPTAVGTATTIEMLLFYVLVFVQFYTVLSMVTTRRGEGVLKRLRTGEARDHEILGAFAAPGALLAAGATVTVVAVVTAAGAPLPVNAVLPVLALAGGLAVFTALALVTSAFTKNAEAAQLTALPVMMLGMVGFGGLRTVLPDGLRTVVDWTPMAAVSDLVHLGWTGRLPAAADGAASGADAPVAGFVDAFADAGRPLVTLAVWIVLGVALAARSFRWDERV